MLRLFASKLYSEQDSRNYWSNSFEICHAQIWHQTGWLRA